MFAFLAPFLVATTFALYACGGGSDGGTSSGDGTGNSGGVITASNYMPHPAGSRWTYSGTGSANGSSNSWSYTDYVSSVSTSTWRTRQDTTDGYVINFYSESGDAIYLEKYEFHASDGSSNNVTTYSPYVLTVPAARSQGAITNNNFTTSSTMTWTGGSSSTQGSNSSTVTINGFESVSVPAGTFANCLKATRNETYSYTSGGVNTNGTNTGTYWLAPGVGMVKYVGSSSSSSGGQTNSGTSTIVLQSYTIP